MNNTKDGICRCGSNRKYADCCFGLTEQEIDNISRGYFFKKAQKDANIKVCFYPDSRDCDKKIIKAHSLQNNRVITSLSSDGYIYMMKTEFTKKGRILKLTKLGRKIATIFTGFCGKHDKEVFAPIEDKDYEIGNTEQESLFAFRALTKEWHAKLVAVNLCENLYSSTIEIELFKKGLELGLDDIKKEAITFRDMLLNKNFNGLCTKVIKIEGKPTIAVSSAITISHDFNGDELDHFTKDDWQEPHQLFLTVVPQNNTTFCLMSYKCEAKETFKFLDDQLIDQKEYIQKERMSQLIISHSENVIFAPSFIDTMSDEEKLTLENEYSRSVKMFVQEGLLLTKNSVSFFK